MPKLTAEQEKDLQEIMHEMHDEYARGLENACKKIQNLQLGGFDARSNISIAISGLWCIWLEQCPPGERMDFFNFGVRAICDDLMETRMREINGEKAI